MKRKFSYVVAALLTALLSLLLCACASLGGNGVYISEVMSSNVSSFCDENGRYCDWIEIYNSTDEDINLYGYSLSDSGMNSKKFVFPSVVLKKNSCLVVFADGNNTIDIENGVFHAPFKISSSTGEGIRLYDASGVLVSLLNVPVLADDVSYGIDADGRQTAFETPTPGEPNRKEGGSSFEESVATSVSAVKGAVIINEYSTNKTQTLIDFEGDFVSWVELYNTSGSDVDLSGWFLSDDAAEKEKWSFPSGTKIKKKGFLLVFLSGKDCGLTNGELHASFKLNGKEDALYLFGEDLTELDSVGVFELFSNLSCGIDANGSLSFFSRATPGAKNTAASFDSVDSARKTKSKELVITEVAAVNTSVSSPDGEYRDYIELLNNTEKNINLKNYRLSDSKKAESFQSLPEYILAPGEYCVVYCGEETTLSNGNLYCGFGLDRYGETVYLADRNGVVVDSLEYSRLSQGVVAGRALSAADSTVYYTSYTPGKKNPAKSLLKPLSNPAFSKSSTYVKKGEKVTLSSSSGEIRYTLDGSTPTERSALYGGAITIKKTTVIRARCFEKGHVPSDTVSATYVVGRKSSLDVVFLTTDSENLYDEKIGIWADGDGYTEEFPHVGANYWQDWERPVTFEYMTADGVSQVCFDAGISVFGQFSRALEQKSVAIRLRDRYGPDEICCPFFENNEVNVFSSLVLRNSGQDFEIAHIRDAFCSRVIKGSIDVDFMDYKPVVCYVNGVYHGIYDLREKIDEDYLANHRGVDSDNVDLIKGNNIVNSGSVDEYKKLLNYIRTHDVTDKNVYSYICSQIDIDELISYWMCESFFSNTDTGNIRFYKERKKGEKWRWIFFDADWSLFPTTYKNSSVSNYIDPNGHGVSNAFDTTIMSTLIKNSDFRKRLVELHAKHLATTFDTERLLSVFDGMIEEIDEEMKYHTERWNSLSYNGWKNNVAVLRKIIEEKRELFIEDLTKTLSLTPEEVKRLKAG